MWRNYFKTPALFSACVFSDLLAEINVLNIIRLSLICLSIGFVVVFIKSRSRAFTFGYGLFFIFWVSYFWYWQNLLRRSEADRHLMYRKNPCENNRPWYNPARYFQSDSKECREFLRQQFTPAHMEYSPMEVSYHPFEFSIQLSSRVISTIDVA